MALMRETIVRPLGLVTQPNKYGQYPAGAFSRAENVVVRAPGRLTQLGARQQQTPSPGVIVDVFSLAVVRQNEALMVCDGLTSTQEVRWYNTTSSAVTIATHEDTLPANAFNFYSGGARPVSLRERTILNANSGADVADPYVQNTSTSNYAFRYSGLPQPIVYDLRIVNATTGLAIQDDEVVTLAATIERTYKASLTTPFDGGEYVLISEPSPLVKFKCPAGSGPCSIGLKIRFGGASATCAGRSGIRAGDVIKIWRSPPMSSGGANLNTESGSTLYLTRTYVVVAGDLTTQTTGQLTDDTEPLSLTEELYTNPGAESLQGARRQPPVANVVAVYQGVAWYGDTTLNPLWRTRIPSGMGDLDSTGSATVRAKGIGVRAIGGATFTGGSANITGVSAANYVGLAVGQRLDGNANATGKTIAALPGGGVVTMSAVSPGGGASGGLYAIDVVEIDGKTHSIPDIQGLLDSIGAGTSSPFPHYNVVSEETIAYREIPGALVVPGQLQLTFNQGFAVSPYRFAQGTALTVRATNGSNYDPPIPTLQQTAKQYDFTQERNRIYWSWDQQPEAVAPGNSLPVGRGTILAAVANRDALWLFCSDGIYRITGYLTRTSGIGAQWSAELIDPTFVLAGPWAYCVLRDRVYAYGTLGLVEITDAGARRLSEGIVGDLLPGASYSYLGTQFMCAVEHASEIWLGMSVSGSTVFYVFNVNQEVFTTYVAGATDRGLVYNPSTRQLVFARSSGRADILSASNGEAGTVDFQPTHAGDPLVAKQWVDLVAMFDSASAGRTVTPRFNGAASTGAALVTRPNDARRSYGVPRSAPAIAHTLAPGLGIPATTGVLMELRGVSLRFAPLSEQQVYR